MKYEILAAGFMGTALSAYAGNGGGFTKAGIEGEYFSNAALSGTAAFERKDVRIDFDWGELVNPGGSIAEPYASFPTDNYSIRWEGEILPAFSDEYTFRVYADDGARLYLRASGASEWTTVIDAWEGAAGTWSEGSVSLTSDVLYELKLEYRELDGEAAVRLYWSADSFAEEVIDPLAEVGSNVTHWYQVYADIMKCARSGWEDYNGYEPEKDDDGWPDSDFAYYFQESLNMGLGLDPLMRGTVTFRFTGRGTVAVAGNVDTGSVVSSYDSESNITTGTFTTVDNDANASTFRVKDTDRDGDYGDDGEPDHDGVTDLQLMRPLEPDATESYDFDALHLDEIKEAYEYFTLLRVDLNNFNQERYWSDRTPPAFFNQRNGLSTEYVYQDLDSYSNGASIEHKIMLCNETGRDLFFNIPHMATGWDVDDTDGYVNKLARLIAYGSDGVEPYDEPQADPVYPPLNPNLRVYLEVSNEIWNWSFYQFHDIVEMTSADADAYLGVETTDPLARADDFPIINYDDLSTDKNDSDVYSSVYTWMYRKIMLRTIQTSNIFRSVFGDDAMLTRIRPIYEWQYANYNSTASKGLVFADNYFNNADGEEHVAEPHPLNYYLWGGGGATYYGSTNEWAQTEIIDDAGFESVSFPTGYTAAAECGDWVFTGTAGIAVDAGDDDDIPPPYDGGQMAYIAGTGSVSIAVTFPEEFDSDVFGVGFKALNREDDDGNSDEQSMQVYFDGEAINARSFNQSGGYEPIVYSANDDWTARVVFWTDSEFYSTETFNIEPGSTHTVCFVGEGDTNQILFLEEVYISSVDSIFDGNMPSGGSANGQVNSSSYLEGLEIQNDWAVAYGLEHITYEGGWSLGGDTGGSPIQNYAKFACEEAAEVNELALDYFHWAGGAINTLGTYAQWPSWDSTYAEEGLLNLTNCTLLKGQMAFLSKLPEASKNGTGIPNVLQTEDAHLGNGTDITGSTTTLDNAGEWASWNVLAPERSDYTITVDASGDAEFVVDCNGETVMTYTGTSNLTSFVLGLEAGQSCLRVRALDDASVTISEILIENDDYASAPIFSPRGGSFEYPVTISISSATTNAVIYYTTDGTTPSAANGTLYTTPFLVSVDSEVQAVAIIDGLNDSVITSEYYQPAGGGDYFAVWEFADNGNSATSMPVYCSFTNSDILACTGPGVTNSYYLGTGLSGSRLTSTNLQQAIEEEDYFSIQLVSDGDTYSLSQIDLRPFSQNRSRTFSLFSSVTGFEAANVITNFDYQGNDGSEELYEIALSGHSNLTELVELRLYVYGYNNKYESAGIGNGDGVDLIVYGGVTDAYAAWAATYSLSGDEEDDTDNDGWSDFYEYALNGNPTNSDDQGLFSCVIDGSEIYVVYARRTDGTVTYTLTSTTNLIDSGWITNDTDDTATIGSLDDSYESVTNLLDSANRTQEYLRLLCD